LRILGIDPGSLVTGWGVVEGGGGAPRWRAHGTVRGARGDALAPRLASIQRALADLVALHRPDVAVVEQVFVAASPRAALVLGQARGVALAALALAGVPVEEVSAREVKLAVVGTGAAEKAQVQRMIQRMLALDVLPPRDAADALAAAVWRAHRGRLAALPLRTRARSPRVRGEAAAWVLRRAR
jgi:crossover junction endodeoxyribonuclease RuvC